MYMYVCMYVCMYLCMYVCIEVGQTSLKHATRNPQSYVSIITTQTIQMSTHTYTYTFAQTYMMHTHTRIHTIYTIYTQICTYRYTILLRFCSILFNFVHFLSIFHILVLHINIHTYTNRVVGFGELENYYNFKTLELV